MFCQYCGTQNPDNAKFCSGCGAPLQPPQSDQPPQNYQPPQDCSYRQQPCTPPVPKKKKGGKIALIIILVVLLLAGIGVGVFFLVRHFSGEDPEKLREIPQEVTQQVNKKAAPEDYAGTYTGTLTMDLSGTDVLLDLGVPEDELKEMKKLRGKTFDVTADFSGERLIVYCPELSQAEEDGEVFRVYAWEEDVKDGIYKDIGKSTEDGKSLSMETYLYYLKDGSLYYRNSALVEKDGELLAGGVYSVELKPDFAFEPGKTTEEPETTERLEPEPLPTEPEPTDPEPLLDFDEFVGLWKYDDNSGWFRIYEDATWNFLNEYSDVMGEGTLVPYVDCIELQGGGDTLRMFVTGPDSLVDSLGGTLTRVDSIEPISFFDANGLYPNIGPDDGRTYLENGTYYRLKDNSAYLRGDAYWQVELLGREESENGRETVGILATCGFTGQVSDQLPKGKKSHGCMSYLCDRYTGAIMPIASSTGNVDGNENMYSASLQVGEEYIDIFYTIDIKWDNDDPDWDYMLYQTVYVEFPAGYDGLMFCMIEMPETAEQNQDYIDRDNARAVPEVMGEDYMESIRNGLIFSIG